VFRKQPIAFIASLCLSGGGITLALDQPGHPAAVQPGNDAEDKAGQRVAAGTAAAIEALGSSPAAKKISAIVFKAVRSSPENVLAIVYAAVRVSPKAAVSEIVTAATAAVPNPWKQVTYRSLAALHRKRTEPDYKGGPEGSEARDGGRAMDLGGSRADASGGRGLGGTGANSTNGSLATGPADQSAVDPSLIANAANGTGMTLAEAIAHTAFDAQPGLSFSALTAAVDIALRSDPATLLRYIQSPSAVSGVGDAGLSNYANEPLRTPKQPVVSR